MLAETLSQTGRSLEVVYQWAFARIRSSLPASWTCLGERAVARLARLDGAGSVVPDGVLRRSWLGEVRRGPALSHDAALPLILVLDARDVFHRQVGLNRTIFRRGDDAVRARLARYSPLHESDSVVSWRRAGSTYADRDEAHVWIASRARLDEVVAQLSVRTREWRIVGSGGAVEGEAAVLRAPALAQSNPASISSVLRSGLVTAAILVLVAAAVLSSASDRQRRELDAAAAAHADLLVRAQRLRELDDLRTDLDAVVEIEDAYPRIHEILSAWRSVVDDQALPERIARLDVLDAAALRVWPADASMPAVNFEPRQSGANDE